MSAHRILVGGSKAAVPTPSSLSPWCHFRFGERGLEAIPFDRAIAEETSYPSWISQRREPWNCVYPHFIGGSYTLHVTRPNRV